jgi:hypothetical protein
MRTGGCACGAVRYEVSDELMKGFCGECGSSLLWDEAGSTHMSICAGTIDAPTGLSSKAHIYVGSKGDYYSLPDDGLVRYHEFK